jgi:hypothetical protein
VTTRSASASWRDRFRGAPICRNPWIVEGFLNGVLCAARRNRDTGLVSAKPVI